MWKYDIDHVYGIILSDCEFLVDGESYYINCNMRGRDITVCWNAKTNEWSSGIERKDLEGLSFSTLLNPVPLGIVLGLFFGKQIGVFVLSYISVKLNFADKPNNSTWPAFYAVSILTGIGFTMSLFVGNLAFANNMEYMDGVKIGVLAGSLLSTLFGYFLLLIFSKK